MSFEIITILVIIALAFFFFASEKFSIDKTGFFILLSLLAFGFITPEEAIKGFSDNAVMTIMLLMILAIVLEKNGVVSWIAQKLLPIFNLPNWFFIPLLMICVATLSSFIATTAVVVIFIKLINEFDKSGKIDKSQLLLPISFAGILGGSCTLLGTSTNLIVSDISNKQDLGRFGFFEFSLAGVLFLLVSIPVIYFLSKFILPKHSEKELDYNKNQVYVTSMKIKENSKLIDKKVSETEIWKENTIRLIKIQRGKKYLKTYLRNEILKENDILWLELSVEDLTSKTASLGLNILGVDQDELDQNFTNEYHEVIILPNSKFLNLSVEEFNEQLPENIYVKAYASDKNDRINPNFFYNIFSKKFINPGNRVLLTGNITDIQKLASENNLLFTSSVISEPFIPNYKKWVSLLAMLMVIVLSATETFTILKSSLLAVGFCLFTGCLNLKDAYSNINWQVIFLLASMIPLGIAMHNTGTDEFLGDFLYNFLKKLNPKIIIPIIFIFTMIVSGFVSNNATAIIVAPVVIIIAQKLNINPKPLLYAVMFGANFSFYTPMGYQTNAIIYGMGIYKFKHFFIIGGILSIILIVMASIVLPTLYK